MKNQKKQKNVRFKTSWSHQSPKQRIETMRPEDLVVSIRRAEKEALPVIKEMKVSPMAAQFILAQYTHVLVTGNNHLSTESAMNAANKVLSLWKDGIYILSSQYPFTLEETLQEMQGDLRAKKDYSDYFQAFIPSAKEQPRGIEHVSGGIVKHPETNLWQIWTIVDGPCGYLGAYRDPKEAQRNFEEIVLLAIRGGTEADCKALIEKTLSRGDGLPKQIPFDMMTYLMEHIHLYKIQL